HDDLMMNLVMFGYFAVGNSFEEITDVSLKDMMFKQRMQEIEADVLPFGFIDDGLDDVVEDDNIIENVKPWYEDVGTMW
ncbi:MAG TPA: hypothetical protein DCW83_04965, partial [Saprospirales bacterium]|nr:hypothetical protein [Saprospirales bacterium]